MASTKTASVTAQDAFPVSLDGEGSGEVDTHDCIGRVNRCSNGRTKSWSSATEGGPARRFSIAGHTEELCPMPWYRRLRLLRSRQERMAIAARNQAQVAVS